MVTIIKKKVRVGDTVGWGSPNSSADWSIATVRRVTLDGVVVGWDREGSFDVFVLFSNILKVNNSWVNGHVEG